MRQGVPRGSRQRRGRALALGLALAAGALLGALALAPAAATASECSIDTSAVDPGNEPSLLDSGGYEWDVSEDTKMAPDYSSTSEDFATLYDGGVDTTTAPAGPRSKTDTFDGFGALFVGPGGDAALANQYFSADDDSCSRGRGGREIVFPVIQIGTLQVQRKLFVPTERVGARILNLITNPTGKAVVTSVQVGAQRDDDNYGDLGSDSATAVPKSSSGDAALTTGDLWAVTSDGGANGDPRIAHVIDGPGGRERIDFVTLIGIGLGLIGNPNDNLAWRWENVSIQPGQTIALMSFEVQQALASGDPGNEEAAAAQRAAEYVASGGALGLKDLTLEERAQLANWQGGVRCADRPVTIAGTAGPDVIRGTSKADVIWAGAGKDIVRGLGGNDRICLGSGNDKGFGANGRDFIYGQAGLDRLYGNAGGDRLFGGALRDLIFGGAGNDRGYGQAGNDLLVGNSGRDFLFGGAQRDALRGLAGRRDLCNGGPARDLRRAPGCEIKRSIP